MNRESLLLAPDTPVTCPTCEAEFSLEQGFAKQALESIETSSARALDELKEQERASVEKRAQQLAAERARTAQQQVEDLRRLLAEQGDAHTQALAEMRTLTEQSFMPQLHAIKERLAESQAKLSAVDQREAALAARERSIEARVQEASAIRAAELVAGERQGYEKRLAETQAQLKTLRDEQIALREERQRLKDEKEALSLEVRKQVDTQLQQRETTVRAQEAERSKLREADLQKKLDDLTAQLSDAQRKAEQGSQQLQGEVLELAIEEGLRRAFPLDTIEEVKKGHRGGDVLQHVVTRTGQAAGTILWETKRAKDWSVQWIPKLKEDMRASGAAVGILVTMPGALPKEWPAGAYFALHEEVWVTQASTSIGIAEALRAGLIDLHRQRAVSAGKGEKMEALYDYLTSPQFAQKLKAVYETFTKMRDELESEKNVTLQRWARREKQLQSGVNQLLGVAGDIQGLSQQELPMLELEGEKE